MWVSGEAMHARREVNLPFPLFCGSRGISLKWGGCADGQGTRAEDWLHESLTKNHGFLVQAENLSAIIVGRRENHACCAGRP